MKRIIALLLSISIVLSGCSQIEENKAVISTGDIEEIISTSIEESEEVQEEQIVLLVDEKEPEFSSLDSSELLNYIEDEVYTSLVESLDPESFYIEEVSTVYVSKEYLEELEYNSQSNIFFGYNLADLDAVFQGSKYVFTVDDLGQTVVEELVEVSDNTYDKIIKNVVIGSGVILISVTVALITKNPASAVDAGKTVKMIFTASSMGAKAGTKLALESAAISGTAAVIMEAIRTGDTEMIAEKGLLAASEAFKFGAIFGTTKGIADGIKIVGNSRFFPEGSPQAKKYPEGVEFTKAKDGNLFPRFEKWAKATAKFDTPTLANATNHTGLSGSYYWDAKLANAQCGFKQTPPGYVWHHVEDMKTMILIPQDLHSVAMGGMSHTGGASLIRAFLGL